MQPASFNRSSEGVEAPMDITQDVFPLIETNDVPGVISLLDEHPGLVHSRRTTANDSRTALQLAAAHGNLELCRLLVDRGVEVYPNPMTQYPPVFALTWPCNSCY